MKPDVLVAFPLRPQFAGALKANYTPYRLDEATDKDAFLEGAGRICTAMVANGHVSITRATLNQLPALKLVACSSAGFDLMDLSEMTRRGIRLTNASPCPGR